MAGPILIPRRTVGSVLLAFFVTVTVQAGFFHSCSAAGHGSAAAGVDDPSHSAHSGASVCTACLLTRTLTAAEPTRAPEPTYSECSEETKLAKPLFAAAAIWFPTTARSPPAR
ncbi:MAG: hypothetical protein V2I67_06645 [Thermoanaerobaculales bacterium]|jgi:hypothetical protein|nr:hypothetical protein [Thermoanaerobaculales bacterium]